MGLDIAASGTTIYVETTPTHGTISHCYGLDGSDPQDIACRYTPTTAHFNGTDTFRICTKDNVRTRVPGDFRSCRDVNVNIAPVNDPPILADNTFTSLWVSQGVVDINLMAGLVDVDDTGETFTITGYTQITQDRILDFDCSMQTHCQLTHHQYSNCYLYDRIGEIRIEYTVEDSEGASATQSSSIKVYTPYVWTGNGGDSLFSNPANWCGSLSATLNGSCLGASQPPTHPSPSSVLMYFNELCETNCTSPNLTVDIDISPYTFKMQENFGTVTMASGKTFNNGAGGHRETHVDEGSTFDMTNAANSSISELHIAGFGNFFAPAQLTLGSHSNCGNTNPGGNGTRLGPGFHHNNGKVILSTGAGFGSCLIITHYDGETNFWDLEIDNNARTTPQTIYQSINVQNNLNVKNGIIALNSQASSIRVYGDVFIEYTSADEYGGVGNTGQVILAGTNKTLNVDNNITEYYQFTIGEGGTISVPQTDITISHLHIENGTFTAPSGNLNFVRAGAFNYESTADDANIKGLVVSANTGNFIHNSGNVIFKGDLDNEQDYDITHALGIKAEEGIILNNMLVDMTSSYTYGSGYLGGNKGFSKLLVQRNTQVDLEGNLDLESGTMNGGAIEVLSGTVHAKCIGGPTSDDCFRGGSTEIIFNTASGQILTVDDNATAPVLTINNGEVYELTGSNQGVSGLRILDGTFSAPAVLRLGPESYVVGIQTDNHPSYIDKLYEVGSSGAFVHNSGLVNVTFRQYGWIESHDSYRFFAKFGDVTGSGDFYNLQISTPHGLSNSSNGGCITLSATTVLDVNNDLTVDSTCVKDDGSGKIRVQGNVIFEPRTKIFQPILELNGSGNQRISKTDFFTIGLSTNWNDSEAFTGLVIDKSGSGYVEFLDDFNTQTYEKFLYIDVKAGDTLYLNNYGVNYDSQLGSGTIDNGSAP